MSSGLFRLSAVLRFAFRRLASHRWLALATAAGLAVSVALVMSIPLYADAIQFRILSERLTGQAVSRGKLPLAFLFEYQGRRAGGPQWLEIEQANTYFSTEAGPTLEQPVLDLVRHFKTDTYMLFPPHDPERPETNYLIEWVQFTTLNDLEKHIRLVSGAVPASVPAGNEPVEVLVSEPLSLELGLLPGDLYFSRRDDGPEIPVRIAGVWAPVDPSAPYWKQFEKLLLVPEPVYTGRISQAATDEAYSGSWYIVVDGFSLHSGDVAGLLERIHTVRQRLEMARPGVELSRSPVEALEQYSRDAPALTLLLYAFSIPIIGLILAFIGLVAGQFISQHQNEIAVLRSRGASAGQVVGVAAVEGILLGILAVLAGVPSGEFIAHAIGQARSFLNFTAKTELRVSLTAAALAFGLGGTAFVLLTQIVVPALMAGRRTIVTYKQEQARSLRPPWWQRLWLDVFLIIPAVYSVFLLRQQGSIAKASQETTLDPFQNPLLLLAPALVIFALTLFMLRLVPRLMAGLAWLAGKTGSVGFVTAARYLSRTPAYYSTPLALLVLTLSLSAFTASLAQTLDRHLHRQLYYQAGADLSLEEMGIAWNEWISSSGQPGARGGSQPVWVFNPVEDHLRLPGVQAVTRVGSYPASIGVLEGPPVEGRFIGIDRLTFPQVAFWQRNFARSSLGELMNQLAHSPEGVLVSAEFLAEQALNPGDSLTLVVTSGPASILYKATIAGSVDLFPTWYPEAGPLVVGNLSHLFQAAGGDQPYWAWLKTAPEADHEKLAATVRGYTDLLDPEADFENVVQDGLNIFVRQWKSAPLEIISAQRRPERQGLFGLLSVGFAASALLTVIGFLLYTIFSFRRRFIELGVLRAIGLSTGQLVSLLAWELAFLLLIGIGVGTALGVWISLLFIPFLQVGVETAALYPPFIVEIAWPSIFQIYALFGGLFIIALLLLVIRLVRMKIFQAIKLGETT